MKRTIFIGQAMPRNKKHPHDWPSLNVWLHSIGIKDEDIKANFFYSALVDYFPGAKNGSHRVPTNKEIETEKTRLKKTISSFNPEIVVPIGKLSISKCLGKEAKALKDYIGKTYKVNPYGLTKSELLVIPLPHPSGASTWRYKAGNKKLLSKALGLLKANIGS